MKKIIVSLITFSFLFVLIWGVNLQTRLDAEADKLAKDHFGKALRLMKQTDYLAAIDEYKKVVELLPQSEMSLDARYWIGQTYFLMENYDQALDIFEKLIHNYPDSAIIPVTRLMITRIKQEKDKAGSGAKSRASPDQKFIIDPKTGVKYSKFGALSGKKDVGRGYLSPNGKFFLHGNLMIPMGSGEPFEFTDMDVAGSIWSPDRKKVAFYSDNAIWVIPVSPETGKATGPAKRIAENEYVFQGPVSWAPDSKRVVFGRFGEKEPGDIWTVSVEDGTLTQVTNDPAYEGAPKWSPDGKTILYICRYFEIWLISADGENPRKIIDYGRPIGWSPDGKWITFYSRGSSNLNLFRLSDERVFEINPPEGVGNFLSWSLDGEKLFFYRNSYAFVCNLKVVSTSGGPSFQLGRGLEFWPYVHYWSPDSRRIVTSGWMLPITGGEAQKIELDVSGVIEPVFRSLSPDCTKLLLFEKKGDDKEDLYVSPVSLEAARASGPAVKVFQGRYKQPVSYGRRDEWAWSPDGKKLALVHEGDIWITSASDGKPVRITSAPEHETYPVWSPNGKKIAYIVKLSHANSIEGEQCLYIVSSSGGEAKKILNIVDRDLFAWSLDSKELAILSEGKILIYSISSEQVREITDLWRQLNIKRCQVMCLMPDGRHFAIIGETEEEYGSRNRIYLISVKGDTVTELGADDEGWKDWMYPSPDGKWISYDSEEDVKVRSEGSFWEVEVDDIIKKEE
jgi:Tol biopolymer transport system component